MCSDREESVRQSLALQQAVCASAPGGGKLAGASKCNISFLQSMRAKVRDVNVCTCMHACVHTYIHAYTHARTRAHTQVFLQRMCTPRDMPLNCLYNRLLSSSGSSLLILTKQTLNRL